MLQSNTEHLCLSSEAWQVLKVVPVAGQAEVSSQLRAEHPGEQIWIFYLIFCHSSPSSGEY